MKKNYSAFLQRMIDKYEGGYGWDKADAGGPTKYGITCFRLAEHRGQTMHSMAAWAPIVQAMGRKEAEDIYAKYYAIPCKFDELPSGVDACTLDYGVNSGPGRGMSVLRAITGASSNDAAVATAKKMDPHLIIDAMCDERLAFMKRIKGGSQWAVFGKGWGARVLDLRAYCHALADKKAVSPAIDLSDVWTPKAEATKSNPVRDIVAGTGGSGGAAAGGKASGFSWGAVVVIFVVGVAAACIYAWHKYRQAKKENAILLPA